jgi:hypothetical protein
VYVRNLGWAAEALARGDAGPVPARAGDAVRTPRQITFLPLFITLGAALAGHFAFSARPFYEPSSRLQCRG